MIRKGTSVTWKWGRGTAKANVQETHTTKITRTIDGTDVTATGAATTLPLS